MIKINNQLLIDVGLGNIPPEEKRSLLQHLYRTLEKQVGKRLSDNMSPDQLAQFEGFIREPNSSYSEQYLAGVYPNWRSDEKFIKQLQSAQVPHPQTGQPIPEYAVINEFASLKWLENNYPAYKDVVADELKKLKEELIVKAPSIKAATGEVHVPAGVAAFQGQAPSAPAPASPQPQSAMSQPPQPPTAPIPTPQPQSVAPMPISQPQPGQIGRPAPDTTVGGSSQPIIKQ